MELLQLPIQVRSITTLVDGSLKFQIITQEVNSETVGKLFDYRNVQGWMVIKPARISKEDIVNIPNEVKEFKTDKTTSQRLRAVIFLVWKNTTSQKETFDDFYKRHIETIIQQYKEKLE